MSSIYNLLRALWDAFAGASPLANAVTLLTPLSGAFWVIRAYVRRSTKDKDGQIRRLQEDLERREVELGKATRELGELKLLLKKLEDRSPKTVLQVVEDELVHRNYEPANRAVANWIKNEGEAISMLLLRRAEWATAHSVGDIRAMGLVGAETYAIASMAFYPQNLEARTLLVDLEKLGREEGQLPPARAAALIEFDGRAYELFNSNLASAAEIAEQEVMRRNQRSRYHAALPVVDLALTLRFQSVGQNAASTLGTQNLKIEILNQLGRPEEALTLAQSVTNAGVAHPTLGATHSITMRSRFLLATALYNVGRKTEALPIAQSVSSDKAAHLGTTDPSTLVSLELCATLLCELDRSEEALAIVRSVVEAAAADPQLGPTHRITLRARMKQSAILHALGQRDHALVIAEEVAAVQAVHRELGPNHPETLTTYFRVSQLLRDTGRNQEALGIAETIAEASAVSPERGPTHPETLANRTMVASILNALGRNEEALPIIRNVTEIEIDLPSMGDTHRNTLASRMILAKILTDLGLSEEALAIAQSVVATATTHPDLGPSHPLTAASVKLLAKIHARLPKQE